jgi:adenylate cyclase
MLDVEMLFEWLVDGAPGAVGPLQVVDRLCAGLVAAGVPLHRCEAFVRTLHPQVVGRSFLWLAGAGIEVREQSYAYLNSESFTAGPVGALFRTGEARRHRLGGDSGDHGAGLDELVDAGYTDFYAGPMPFINGEVHAITFATRVPAGFTDDAIAAIDRVLRPLSRVAEILALTRTAANLLSTYVGRNAGGRILAGRIQRGDADTIDAVLWFSDLRGFTELSQRIPSAELLRVLNDLFDCQVPAIERHGGEVLKFIGDGLLAIFPLAPGGAARDAVAAALVAADEAAAALERLNLARRGAGRVEIHYGLALHVGEVAYGNIGGSGRLDFTCIGPAVNLAARLESLTGRLGVGVAMSEVVARQCGRPVCSLGSFELKGITEPVEAFGLA